MKFCYRMINANNVSIFLQTGVIGLRFPDNLKDQGFPVIQGFLQAVDPQLGHRGAGPGENGQLFVDRQQIIRQKDIAYAAQDQGTGFTGVGADDVVLFFIDRKDTVPPGKHVFQQIGGDIENLAVGQQLFGRDVFIAFSFFTLTGAS